MNKHIISLAAAAILFTSCSKELQRVNINPNNLETPDATTLLSNTIVTEFFNNASIAWTLANGYDQYMTFSSSYYDQPTRYSPVSNSPYWTAMYEAARDANTLYATGVKNGSPFLQAAALTLRSYAFAQLTELWGDIPFTQALQGSTGSYTPAYDNQQTVYTDANAGIIPSLRRADSLLKANPSGLLGGDLLFNASTAGWRRFINALRLRYLLRVSARMDPSAEMQAIVSDGALMQNAGQSGTLTLPTITPYNFPSLTERTGDFQVKYMNSLLYNVFVNTGDSARIQAYFTRNPNNASKTDFNFNYFGGMPMVIDADGTQTNTSSNFNASFVSGANKNLIMARVITYAEQELILAEAAVKGFISGDAQTYYNNGVTGAFAEIGITDATGSNYLGHTGVVFDNSTTAASLQQIITQKWLTNINNGFEGWIEYRRTGYPALQAGGGINLNNGAIPTRFLYPTDEVTINARNYKAEVANMGGTEITTYKAWWEK
ncbi:MAG TPA: SusD/RagB family nutrient-binding outer membrane lipoprotein [Puia sp.]|nr:SusD/RagB family nutrient-binding outer membrane lipoprotein [Puia sp.]